MVGSNNSRAVPWRWESANVIFSSSREKAELWRKYRLQSRIKLSSFWGSEPSKISGSYILGVGILGDLQSAWVMSIITWAKSGVDSPMRGLLGRSWSWGWDGGVAEIFGVEVGEVEIKNGGIGSRTRRKV